MRAGGVKFAVVLALAAAPDCAPVAAKPATASRELPACSNFAGWRAQSLGRLAENGKPHKACAKTIKQGEAVEVLDPDAGEGSATVIWRAKPWFVDADSLEF
jgi:hypothetical protein